jgi:hypothetical protein
MFAPPSPPLPRVSRAGLGAVARPPRGREKLKKAKNKFGSDSLQSSLLKADGAPAMPRLRARLKGRENERE